MIYAYRCYTCQHTQDAERSMAEREIAPACDDCGGGMRQIITPIRANQVMGGADNPGYISPMSGEFIDSKRKRRYEMAKYDVVERG